MAVSGFLKQVISLKARDVAEAQALIPLKDIREQGEKRAAESSRNISGSESAKGKILQSSFVHAMEKSGPGHAGIIAEIKKASPSKGDIRPDLNPAHYAKEYTHAGAAAISVLTESHFFKGTIEDLKAVRAVTHLPVLRKDFTISSYQIYESRAVGADAVLLITSILSREQLRDYVVLARELGMEPLVEIHSEWELENALFASARVIGINNRNLETLKTDLNVSKRVVPFFSKDQIAVEASGISSPQDIEKGIECGIFNFLVGESIVRSDNTRRFVQQLVKTGGKERSGTALNEQQGNSPAEGSREIWEKSGTMGGTNLPQDPMLSSSFFRQNSKQVAVKICGLTTPEEALACARAGADAIGLVFHAASPRNISMEQGAEIAEALPEHIMTTGVFVDKTFDFIMERVLTCHLKAVQLHGNESPDLVKKLSAQGLIVVKALFAARKPHLDQASLYSDAHALLVEYGKGALPGGNAEAWNWELAGSATAGRGKQQKIVAAGGITPDNVLQAVDLAQPWAVDLSSGVESSPGRKDIEKVKKLMDRINTMS